MGDDVCRTRIDVSVCLALLVIAALLRLWRLDQEALWADEFYTWFTSSGESTGAVLAEITRSNPHPPLYFLLVHGVIRSLGDSDFLLRLPSAVAGAITIPVFYMVVRIATGKRLFPATAAALLMLSPMHLWYSQEARAYALLVLWEVFFLLGLACFLRTRDRRKMFFASMLIVCAGTLSVYTHYFAAFHVLPGLGLLVFSERWLPEKRTFSRIASVLLVALCLPAGIAAIGNMRSGKGIDWLPGDFGIGHLRDVLGAQVLGPLYSPLPLWLYISGLVAGGVLMVLGAIALRRESHPLFWIAGVGFIATLVTPVFVSLTVKQIIFYGQRYLIIALPFTVALLASAVTAREKSIRLPAWLLMMILLVCQGCYLWNYYTARQKRLWDIAGSQVVQLCPPGTAVYVSPDRVEGLAARYLDNDVYTTAPWNPHARPAGPFALISLTDPRPDMESFGIPRDQYSLGLFETNRPGQDIWLVVHAQAE